MLPCAAAAIDAAALYFAARHVFHATPLARCVAAMQLLLMPLIILIDAATPIRRLIRP